MTQKTEIIEPYEAVEIWCRANGFSDVVDCDPENVNLDRLNQALDRYASDENVQQKGCLTAL